MVLVFGAAASEQWLVVQVLQTYKQCLHIEVYCYFRPECNQYATAECQKYVTKYVSRRGARVAQWVKPWANA